MNLLIKAMYTCIYYVTVSRWDLTALFLSAEHAGMWSAFLSLSKLTPLVRSVTITLKTVSNYTVVVISNKRSNSEHTNWYNIHKEVNSFHVEHDSM